MKGNPRKASGGHRISVQVRPYLAPKSLTFQIRLNKWGVLSRLRAALKKLWRTRKCDGHHACSSPIIGTLAQKQSYNKARSSIHIFFCLHQDYKTLNYCMLFNYANGHGKCTMQVVVMEIQPTCRLKCENCTRGLLGLQHS